MSLSTSENGMKANLIERYYHALKSGLLPGRGSPRSYESFSVEDFHESDRTFKEELIHVVSSFVPISVHETYEGYYGEGDIVPWLDIALVFTTTTLATTILTKFGEDIYSHFKNKFFNKETRETKSKQETLIAKLERLKTRQWIPPICIHVKIETSNISIHSPSISFDSFEDTIDFLSNISQLAALLEQFNAENPPSEQIKALKEVLAVQEAHFKKYFNEPISKYLVAKYNKPSKQWEISFVLAQPNDNIHFY